MKITAPADLPDTGKNALPDTGKNALPDTGKNALPPLGGPPLESKHEYSEAPYKHAVTKSSD
jgi:hypothetical protein